MVAPREAVRVERAMRVSTEARVLDTLRSIIYDDAVDMGFEVRERSVPRNPGFFDREVTM